MKKFKGSLTLEAVIAFTVFLSFMFMLLLMVKMSMTIITLDSVASETAKQLATGAYPIGLFNKVCDELDGSAADIIQGNTTNYEEITDFSEDLVNTAADGILDYFTSETTAGAEKASKDGVLSLIGLPLQYGFSAIGDMIMDKAEEIIGVKGNEMVRGNIINGIREYGVDVDLDNLKLVVCKFPMSKYAYEHGCTSEGYKQLGLTKNDVSKDDVVIGLTYDYELTLPFLPTFNIKLKSVAIEHAWVNGGNGEAVTDGEGIALGDIFFGKHYWVGASGTGNKYHKANCMTLYRGKSAISREQAKNKQPCGLCKPGKIKD